MMLGLLMTWAIDIIRQQQRARRQAEAIDANTQAQNQVAAQFKGLQGLPASIAQLKQQLHNATEAQAERAQFPLKPGSRGRQVKTLQTYLNRVHEAGLMVDGHLGQQTATALQQHCHRNSVSYSFYHKLKADNHGAA